MYLIYKTTESTIEPKVYWNDPITNASWVFMGSYESSREANHVAMMLMLLYSCSVFIQGVFEHNANRAFEYHRTQ